ncbi:CBS domain-containing protein [Robertkochia marina]|uniref:CBS domain-containing protein n=1 Tax=Robertkochia marina TaxID=1227945 RepID=A0A4S3M280_9FLAO|nr:CBS domain-containing protein [Robertkochia marina]THD68950.1 CBS domain-containing protein [Robertkochia marina]TRZ44769.1 CBS domain-containing protein [Robertkochia marina]
MNLHTHIMNDYMPLLPDYTVAMASGMFAQSTCTHIPVVEDDRLLGLLSEEDVAGFDGEKKISDYLYLLDHFYVRKRTVWLDVLEAFARSNSNIMPVLDAAGEYQGYYELLDLIGLFKETPFLSEQGGVVIVEKGKNDYSFSEISQIVESNNGRLLGAFISDIHEDVAQVTVKVSSSGLNEIIQTFRRYSYNVIAGNEDDAYVEELKKRSKYLDKYLNI